MALEHFRQKLAREQQWAEQVDAQHQSLERVNAVWGRGRLLRQVHGVLVDMHYSRGWLALAVARTAPQPSLIKLAVADARALQAEKTPWSAGLGSLILAGAASFESPTEALRLLSDAERQFAATDMALHIEVVRMRRGELTSGGEGLALVDSALERIRTLGVKRPDLFVRMLAAFKAG